MRCIPEPAPCEHSVPPLEPQVVLKHFLGDLRLCQTCAVKFCPHPVCSYQEAMARSQALNPARFCIMSECQQLQYKGKKLEISKHVKDSSQNFWFFHAYRSSLHSELLWT